MPFGYPFKTPLLRTISCSDRSSSGQSVQCLSANPESPLYQPKPRYTTSPPNIVIATLVMFMSSVRRVEQICVEHYHIRYFAHFY